MKSKKKDEQFAHDMNKAFFLKKEERKPQWIKVDAKGVRLGRLATQIANMLQGKRVPWFTRHTDAGDYVVVVNAKDIVLTGNKWKDKFYHTYSGWMGGLKSRSAEEVFQKDPAELVVLAVKRMLPKNKLGREMIKKLKVYADETHKHQAQLQD